MLRINILIAVFTVNSVSGQLVISGDGQSGQSLCPTGFTQHDRSCYRYINMAVNWADAWTFCGTMTSHPVSIESDLENNFLSQFVSDHVTNTDMLARRVWTDGTNIQGSPFVWRSSGTPFTYSRWQVGEPILTSSDVVKCVIKLDNHWYADDCLHQRRFVCEKEIDGIALPGSNMQTPNNIEPTNSPDKNGLLIG